MCLFVCVCVYFFMRTHVFTVYNACERTGLHEDMRCCVPMESLLVRKEKNKILHERAGIFDMMFCT